MASSSERDITVELFDRRCSMSHSMMTRRVQLKFHGSSTLCTAADRRKLNGEVARHARHARHSRSILASKSGVSARMLQGCYEDATRKLLPWNLSFRQLQYRTTAPPHIDNSLLNPTYIFLSSLHDSSPG